MDDFNFQHIMALKEMIAGDQEEESQEDFSYQKGSVLNPGDLGVNKKEGLAKPFSKIEIKKGERPDENQKLNIPHENKKIEEKNSIWKADEVQCLPVQKHDPRSRPEIDQFFKQKVGTEDVFLGMSGMDPTSSKCQFIVVKVFMPDTQFKEIQLDITQNAMVVQSPKYYVHHQFPYPVKDKEGQAQWVTDKNLLQLTLPIIREDFI